MGIQIRKRVQIRRKEGLDLYKGITEYFEHSLHPFSLRGKKTHDTYIILNILQYDIQFDASAGEERVGRQHSELLLPSILVRPSILPNCRHHRH